MVKFVGGLVAGVARVVIGKDGATAIRTDAPVRGPAPRPSSALIKHVQLHIRLIAQRVSCSCTSDAATYDGDAQLRRHPQSRCSGRPQRQGRRLFGVELAKHLRADFAPPGRRVPSVFLYSLLPRRRRLHPPRHPRRARRRDTISGFKCVGVSKFSVSLQGHSPLSGTPAV
eukprot:scaffold3909_cov117-Isochrysis_galbana.AAC.9